MPFPLLEMRGVLVKAWYSLLLVLIVFLFLYSNVYGAYVSDKIFSIDNYLREPQKYGGNKAQVFGKAVSIGKDYFYFDAGQHTLRVSGANIEKSAFGESVALLYFRKDGIIELADYHNYSYNYLIYIISFFAVAVFAFLFFKEWKPTYRGFKDA